jgi:hypothetical protein
MGTRVEYRIMNVKKDVKPMTAGDVSVSSGGKYSSNGIPGSADRIPAWACI